MVDYKSFISSAIISDVLDEMGYTQQLLPSEIKPNFVKARLFGRARTISLKPITDGEDHRDVYKGLYFLEQLNKGEVLVIGNGFKEMAFFGELMATLAQHRGVDGTIIDGCTRDAVETIAMCYPVFARTNYARDIKKRGIVDKLDISVNIGECTIKPGDLLFGDYDAVVVIPRTIENEVLTRCVEVADLEQKIKEDIKRDVSVDDILRERGEF
ncbi:MAG: RraA family protein [Candidatus Nanoarchaeia archaeon]